MQQEFLSQAFGGKVDINDLNAEPVVDVKKEVEDDLGLTDGKEEPLSMSQKVGLVPTKMLDMIPNMASSFVGAKLTYVDDLVFNKLKAHLHIWGLNNL